MFLAAFKLGNCFENGVINNYFKIREKYAIWLKNRILYTNLDATTLYCVWTFLATNCMNYENKLGLKIGEKEISNQFSFFKSVNFYCLFTCDNDMKLW